MAAAHTPKETEALCALYREALTHLLDVITVSALLHDPYVQEAVADARALLHADSPDALAAQRINQTLQDHCYELRDWAYYQIHQRPATQHGYVPPRTEICRILDDIHALTEEGYALGRHLQARGGG